MIATIGAFDGFHKGHQSLLRLADIRADESGTDWGIITFEYPAEAMLIFPKFKFLFTIRERRILEKFFNIPTSIRLPFTKKFSKMTPLEFLDYISSELRVKGIVVGEGFRFGSERSGTAELLARESRERGWTFDSVPLMKDSEDSVISSTAIRKAVAAGDMARAWKMQGYPFFFVNHVIRGNERGRVLGYPTANLNLSREKTSLRYGVYATLVFAIGKWYVGAANVGLNPTFDDVDETRFEVNLLDFCGDLYGQEIAVFIIEHIRDEMRFDSPAGLKEQISRDARIIRDIGGRAKESHAELWKAFGETIESPD